MCENDAPRPAHTGRPAQTNSGSAADRRTSSVIAAAAGGPVNRLAASSTLGSTLTPTRPDSPRARATARPLPRSGRRHRRRQAPFPSLMSGVDGPRDMRSGGVGDGDSVAAAPTRPRRAGIPPPGTHLRRSPVRCDGAVRPNSASSIAMKPTIRLSPRPSRPHRSRSGEANVQDEVTEPQIQQAATRPVHDKGEQDDGEDDQHKPYK